VTVISVPEAVPSRLGASVGLPRKVVWKLVRPFVHSIATQTSHALARHGEQIAELREQVDLQREELAANRVAIQALRKEILATNHRVTWIEESDIATVKNRDLS